MTSEPHALVLGASGISGWSLLNQLHSYPSKDYWTRITGQTNRPFSFEQARISPEDRTQLVSGIDLTAPVDEIADTIKNKVSDVHTVTHIFFTAYIQKDNFDDLKQINTLLLKNSVEALERLAPNLQSVILQTGGKGYGLEFPKEVAVRPPLTEDTPRIPEPWRSNIFYYDQYDLLLEQSKEKKWTFTEIRPDGIVGFVPGNNAMNMAQGIALYLSIYRAIHGSGAEVPFPGYEHGYHSTHSDSFQDILARMEIFAATHPDKCGNGKVFNIANQDEPVTWSTVWPGICAYFGLVGTGPRDGTDSMQKFVEKHMDTWKDTCSTHSLNDKAIASQNWGHVQFMLVQFDFDRQYDLTRAREVGFTEQIDTVESYTIAFDRMVAAHIIPQF